MKCCIDSGAQASIISEDIYKVLKENFKGEIVEIPVSNVSIL